MIEIDADWYVEESQTPPNPEKQSDYSVYGVFTIVPVRSAEFIEIKLLIEDDPIERYDNAMKDLEL